MNNTKTITIPLEDWLNLALRYNRWAVVSNDYASQLCNDELVHVEPCDNGLYKVWRTVDWLQYQESRKMLGELKEQPTVSPEIAEASKRATLRCKADHVLHVGKELEKAMKAGNKYQVQQLLKELDNIK